MAKKTFTVNESNPALGFITPPDPVKEEPAQPAKEKPRRKYRTNPYAAAHIEAKSRHFQLLIRPSMYEWLADEADRREVSINEFINLVLESAKRGQ